MTFHLGRLARSVWYAATTISPHATWSNPAFSSPSAWPPAPAHNSTDVYQLYAMVLWLVC